MRRRVIKKRRFTKTTRRIRKVRPVRKNMKSESRRQNYGRFTIQIDMGDVPVLDTGDRHLEFRNFNAKDLLNRQPELSRFLYVRVKKATLRWTLKKFDKNAYRFERNRTGTYMAQIADTSDGTNISYFPDAHLQKWVNPASLTQDALFNFNFNLDTFSANCEYSKLHSAYGGLRTFKPYVGEVATSMFTNITNVDNNELSTTGRVYKNYKAWHALGAQHAAGWMNDIRLILPEVSRNIYVDNVYDAEGTTLQQVIQKNVIQGLPFYKITLMVEVECRGNGMPGPNYDAPPAPTLLKSAKRRRPDLDETETEKENSKIQKLIEKTEIDMKPDMTGLKDHIVSAITNSNPLIAAVASVAGIRNNIIRDEIK